LVTFDIISHHKGIHSTRWLSSADTDQFAGIISEQMAMALEEMNRLQQLSNNLIQRLIANPIILLLSLLLPLFFFFFQLFNKHIV
jgi:hypothetical protein